MRDMKKYMKRRSSQLDPTYVVAKKRLEKNSGLRDSHFEIYNAGAAL